MSEQTQTEARKAERNLRKLARENDLIALANFLDFIDTEANEELNRLERN